MSAAEGNLSYFFVHLFVILCAVRSFWKIRERIFISLVVILQFETSGKWPDDLTAIQHIKAAFHIRLAELLKSECSLITAASRQHVDVLKVGCCKRISWI